MPVGRENKIVIATEIIPPDTFIDTRLLLDSCSANAFFFYNSCGMCVGLTHSLHYHKHVCLWTILN